MNTILRHIMVIICVSGGAWRTARAQACFTADVTRGCAPLTIQVLDCSGGINIAYKYSEAEGFVPRTTHTYTQPGRYFITQLVQVGTTGDTLRRNNYIEVLPTPEPQFDLKLCRNREVLLEIPDTQYEQYGISWGDGSPTIIVPRGAAPVRHTYLGGGVYSVSVKGTYIPGFCGGTAARLVSPVQTLNMPEVRAARTLARDAASGRVELRITTDDDFEYDVLLPPNPTPLASFAGTGDVVTQVINNLNTTTAPCFVIRARDACGNFVDSEAYYCAIELQATAEDSRNLLQWSEYPASLPAGSFQQYIVYRNNVPLITLTDISQREYLDTNIICRQDYCYSVAMVFNSAAVQFLSTSNEACLRTFSSTIPPRITNLNVSQVSERSTSIFWQVENVPRVTRYTIRRADTEINIAATKPELVDTDLKITAPVCYEIRYENECGNIAPFAGQTCTVFLEARLAPLGGTQLRWTPYRNSENQFQYYVIQKLDERYEVYDEVMRSGIFDLSYLDEEAKTDRQIMRYRIKTVIDQARGWESFSNVVEVKQRFKVFFPNAFRPDGLNSTFAPKGLFIKHFEMRIYNRAGELLYRSRSLEDGWNGQYKGALAPADSYIYIAEIEDNLGEKHRTQGTFVLLR